MVCSRCFVSCWSAASVADSPVSVGMIMALPRMAKLSVKPPCQQLASGPFIQVHEPASKYIV